MKRSILIVGALFALAATSVAQDTIPEVASDSFWRNDILFNALTTVHEYDLSRIRKKAESFRSLPIELEIQFHETRRGNYPFFTRFTDDNYMCFSAWGGEQALWHREEYADVYQFFFVERKVPAMRTILEAKPYQRIRISAVVRDVFRSMPYIEVTKAELLDDSVTEATIAAAAKAEKASETGDTATALAEYERAMRGNLSKLQKAQMHCDIADVYVVRGERENALSQLEQAKKLQPENAKFAKVLDKASLQPLPKVKPKTMDKSGESVASRPSPTGGDKATDAAAKKTAADEAKTKSDK
jgi:tetratricopeptide (TPR) repeat protein